MKVAQIGHREGKLRVTTIQVAFQQVSFVLILLLEK